MADDDSKARLDAAFDKLATKDDVRSTILWSVTAINAALALVQLALLVTRHG